MRRIELKRWTRKNTARMGRCFRALFGIPFGPGALTTLRPLIAFWTSSGLVNIGSMAGVCNYDSSCALTFSMTAGTDGSVIG